MMRTLWILLYAGVLLGCQAQPGDTKATDARLIEQVQPSQGEFLISYRKYRLANGLTVLLHEDHSDPLVHVNVTYHVGSAREAPDRTGFAHLFEHMMFQGSAHVASGQHFRIINEAGGNMNGTTYRDRTSYFQTVPRNYLERVLWLEADRMGFLLDAVDQQKFEIQRQTVKNERAQRFDNAPYGRVAETMGALLYPPEHPYSWQPIGYVKDLDRADVSDLKQFFLRWYGPNNAVLAIGGDIDIAQTLAWVERYFGPLKSGPEVPPVTPRPAVLSSSRYYTLEDQVHLPLIYLAYPTVSLGHPDEASLDMFANILGQGKTSILYKNLVKQGLAVDASASHYCEERACTLSVWAYANPQREVTLAQLETAIDASIEEVASRGVQPDDLARAKGQVESSAIFAMQSVSGKVDQLAFGEAIKGQPNYIFRSLDAYTQVQPEDVQSAYQRYLQGRPRVVLSVVPRGQTRLAAKAPNYLLPERPPSSPKPAEVALRPVKDSFDRSRVPAVGPTPEFSLPPVWRDRLAAGIELMGSRYDETPTVELLIRLKGGERVEPQDKLGVAELTAAMVNQGSVGMEAEQLSQTLQQLGSRVEFSASFYGTLIQVSALKKNLPQTLAIVEQMLTQPAFREADFERLKSQQLQSLQQQRSKPRWLADKLFRQLLLGNDNRQGNVSEGNLQTVGSLTLMDVRDYYRRYYSTREAQVVVVGDLAPEAVKHQLEFLTDKVGPAVDYPPLAPLPQYQQQTIYLVDKPGAAQTVVRVGQRSVPYDVVGEYFLGTLMNFNLGGNFNSRLNNQLREQKGYTYGVSSALASSRELGLFYVAADVRNDATASFIRELLEILHSYREQGVTDDELAYLKSAIPQKETMAFETPEQKAGFMLRLLVLDLPAEVVSQQQRIVTTLSRQVLHQVALRQLDPEVMQILVIGDRSQLQPQLEQLGLPLKIIDG